MKESKIIISIIGFLCASVLVSAISVEKERVINQGGFAFASFGNGAQFTWSKYVAPVINIVQNGTTTTVTTAPGYFTGTDAEGKFVFNKDMYTWTNINKINPDIVQLQKVLVGEGLLGQNAQTGVYDSVTKAAVEAFQKKYNIKPAPQYAYGYFGPLTRSFLNNR